MLRICILEAVVVVWSLFASPLSAQKTFAPATDVGFKCSAYTSKWPTRESRTLSCRVTNVGKTALFVPREWAVTCPTTPHLWAGFRDSSGKDFIGGYGGDCSPTMNSMTIPERMSKEAVLLKPGEHLYLTFLLDPKRFGLKPGVYRVNATLSGWSQEKFTATERSELAQLGHPFMTGMLADSIRVRLTPQ
jgi:hypothetical protein